MTTSMMYLNWYHLDTDCLNTETYNLIHHTVKSLSQEQLLTVFNVVLS